MRTCEMASVALDENTAFAVDVGKSVAAAMELGTTLQLGFRGSQRVAAIASY